MLRSSSYGRGSMVWIEFGLDPPSSKRAADEEAILIPAHFAGESIWCA
jgi:hypothetical protein